MIAETFLRLAAAQAKTASAGWREKRFEEGDYKNAVECFMKYFSTGPDATDIILKDSEKP